MKEDYRGEYLPSFAGRRGRRLKAGKQSLMDDALPHLQIALPHPGETLPLETLGHYRRWWLEIGFGGGEHLAGQAARHRDTGFLGCEPYPNGVAQLLEHIKTLELENIRISTEDARLLLAALPDACLERVFILFPDPWPKLRHHKRRLVSLPTLRAIARVLRRGGILRLATDHADYGSWILEHTLACSEFQWCAEAARDWLQPPADWIKTRYEMKTRAEGRRPLYLDFERA